MTTFQIIRPNPEPVETEATPGRVYRDADGDLYVRLGEGFKFPWLAILDEDRAMTTSNTSLVQPLTELTADEVESELG